MHHTQRLIAFCVMAVAACSSDGAASGAEELTTAAEVEESASPAAGASPATNADVVQGPGHTQGRPQAPDTSGKKPLVPANGTAEVTYEGKSTQLSDAWQGGLRVIETTGSEDILELSGSAQGPGIIVNFAVNPRAEGLSVVGDYDIGAAGLRGRSNRSAITLNGSPYTATAGIVRILGYEFGRVRGEFNATFGPADGSGTNQFEATGSFEGTTSFSCFALVTSDSPLRGPEGTTIQVKSDHPFCQPYSAALAPRAPSSTTTNAEGAAGPSIIAPSTPS